jgi:hypothetical protein
MEVDEVESEGLFGLTHLPVLAAIVAFEVLAEAPRLIGEPFVGSRAHQESPDPSDAVRRCLFGDEPCPEEELPELLQGGFEIALVHLARPASGPPGVSDWDWFREVVSGNDLCEASGRLIEAGGWQCQRRLSLETTNWRRRPIPGIPLL